MESHDCLKFINVTCKTTQGETHRYVPIETTFELRHNKFQIDRHTIRERLVLLAKQPFFWTFMDMPMDTFWKLRVIAVDGASHFEATAFVKADLIFEPIDNEMPQPFYQLAISYMADETNGAIRLDQPLINLYDAPMRSDACDLLRSEVFKRYLFSVRKDEFPYEATSVTFDLVEPALDYDHITYMIKAGSPTIVHFQ